MSGERQLFVGRQLQIYENRLRNRGTILFIREADNLITFFTELGKYTFYVVHPKKPSMNARLLQNGDWKFCGDTPRWAYVKAPSVNETLGGKK